MNKIVISRAANGYIVMPEPDRPYRSPFFLFGGQAASTTEPEEESRDLVFVAKTWEEAVEISARELGGMDVPAVFRE